MAHGQKSVLITGCSAGGIGHELAKEYHFQGLRVFATARRLSAMQTLRDLGIECLQLDVTKLESIQNIRNQISHMTGGILDILVNNAGQSYSVPATDIKIEEVKTMFEINLFGVFSMVQEFVHLLIASGDGRIINIGSITAILPYAFGSTYNAAKAALHAYGNTLRVELKPFNVKVTTIATGGVKSGVAQPQHRRPLPSGSLYQPMNDDFINKRQGRSQKDAMPAAAYARTVVAATLKTHPKAWVWCGKNSWLVWFLDTFFPRRIFDFFVAREFGLDKFQKVIQARQKTK